MTPSQTEIALIPQEIDEFRLIYGTKMTLLVFLDRTWK